MDSLFAPFDRANETASDSVVRTLGLDAPRELILAAGLVPVRLVAPVSGATPRADAIMGNAAMGARGKRLLEQVLALPDPDVPLLITHADADQPQLFAALRELARLGQAAPRDVHFLDLLHIDRSSSRTYNLHRMHGLAKWLERLTGQCIAGDDIAAAQSLSRRQADLIRSLDSLRVESDPRLSGTAMLRIIGAAASLAPLDHIEAMTALLESSLPTLSGRRVYVTGSAHEGPELYTIMESCGAIIVGEDHGWGMPFVDSLAWDTTSGALADLADPIHRKVARTLSAEDRASILASDVMRAGAEFVIHLTIDGDESAPWDMAAIRRALLPKIPLLAVRTTASGEDSVRSQVMAFLRGEAPSLSAEPPPSPAPSSRAEPQRSRKSLASVATFNAYQRQWFADVQRQVDGGAPFAIVNANAPQEILRALDIPFVVNQWWASIVAAKQQTKRYLGLLDAHHYPTDVEAYSAQGLAALFDDDPDLAPWGGLPRPDFVHAVASGDADFKLFEQWGRETDAESFVYESSVDPRPEISIRWWEDLPDRWDEVLESERIDLLVTEMQRVIDALETTTGRQFSTERFAEVMALVNEQEHYYRRTRDLIAATVPAPIGVVDSMPATMVPQWHRGTEWGRDAAKAFYAEVKARADAGLGAAVDEKIRLMWVGRGLWSNMGFYQTWEESHGAVFVWSMYLALAADGYIRSISGGRDPMRALAARFLTMGDELRMPTWASEWHVHEAQTHNVDAAVALSDADPFVIRALRAAGVPVLELGADNFGYRAEEATSVEQAVTDFIEGPAARRADQRHVCA